MKFPVPPFAAAAAVALAAASYPTLGEAQGFNRFLNCAEATFTVRISATYTEQNLGSSVIKQLDVDLEADKRSSFQSGQKVTFFIDGKKIGAVTLKKDRNGDLDADFKLRSSGKGFPTVKDGSKATAEVRDVKVASCKLR